MSSSLAVDDYVVRTLMPDLVGHDRQPSAFIVYLFLWQQTDGGRDRNVAISLRAIAEGTGLSKRAVQMALTVLARRRLVTTRRDGPTAIPAYTLHRPWARKGGGSGRRGESGA
jgi:DNA-binding transcriptional ArsR family regulator